MEPKMPEVRFLQIHTLTTYPAALLNRDDAGLAKRLPFGGTTRARISSQCQKRHWRMASDDPWALRHVGVPMGSRTKEIVGVILQRASEKGFFAEPIQGAFKDAVEKVFLTQLYGKNAEDPKKRQALFFGEPEIEFLIEKAAEALRADTPESAEKTAEQFFKEERENMRALKNGAGLESALFGRMVTSDPAANTDAAIHVAHAFSVHEIERELDFMTAVDDLKSAEEGDDAGAAGMFDMELASGLYYGYVVVDVPLLVDNLAKNRAVAGKVVEHLVHLIAQVSPGAKKGSTAPYAWAELVLVEAGARQPRTLANAFRSAVSLRDIRQPLLDKAVARMRDHLSKLDGGYGTHEARRALNLSEVELPSAAPLDLDALAAWGAESVRMGVTE
jgi:CRISPR system Cascade subunit CasC